MRMWALDSIAFTGILFIKVGDHGAAVQKKIPGG